MIRIVSFLFFLFEVMLFSLLYVVYLPVKVLDQIWVKFIDIEEQERDSDINAHESTEELVEIHS